jgi:AraC-like DNA-binding protein
MQAVIEVAMNDEAFRKGRNLTVKTPPSHPSQERRRWSRQQQPQEGGNPPAQPALKPLVFSTEDLPAGDQFSAWQAHAASLVEVRLPDSVSLDQGFPARHVAWNLGGMLIVQQRAPAHSYRRSDAKLRSSLIDHWSVIFRRVGRSWTEVGGGVAESQPGSVEIRSLGHAFRGRMVESEFLTLYMPRDLFTDSVGILDANNNSILSKNLAGVFANYINSIELRLNEFTAEDLPGVINATRDMIIACVSSSDDRAPAAPHQAMMAPMERARRFIRNNLNSNTMTPDTLCRELGLSRTHLYQLFEPSGGVVRYIQKQRLLVGHIALSDPSERRQISAIADDLGFSSSADFSRAFSREFGYSPRQARSQAVPTHGARDDRRMKESETRSFESWLKTLGS